MGELTYDQHLVPPKVRLFYLFHQSKFIENKQEISGTSIELLISNNSIFHFLPTENILWKMLFY